MTTPAVTYFQRATSSLRANATIVVFFQAAAIAADLFFEPQSQRRLRLMARHSQASWIEW